MKCVILDKKGTQIVQVSQDSELYIPVAFYAEDILKW